jgi:uncharacterized protein (DUF1800 family)
MATWNLDNAAHLLRRAGFGGSPNEIQTFFNQHDSIASAVDALLAFNPTSKGPPAKADSDFDTLRLMQRWWVKLITKARPADAAREKLVVFLHNFLVSGVSKLPEFRYAAWQNSLFRLLGKGNFKTLIREFTRDPANLYYLDGILNDASAGQGRGPGDTDIVVANENYGRELMELFTLGPFQFAADGSNDPAKPNYSEDDVHNLARACTGWVYIDHKLRKGVFQEYAYDGGAYDDDGDGSADPITIFGQQSNNFRIDEGVAGGSDDVLELIFSRTDDGTNNQVAMFVARKVWQWYAYPPPAPGLKAILAGLAAEFVANDFSMEALLRAAWNHDEFYSDAAKSRTVKSPLDYAVQALKALHVRGNGKNVGDAPVELGEQLSNMGMTLFEPPNVAGWPGGLAWITSGTLIERFDFARYLAASDFGAYRIRLAALEKLELGSSSVPPGDVVDQIIAQLGLDVGPVALTTAQRDVLVAYASDNGTRTSLDLSSEFTDDAVQKVRGVLSLALQAAEAQVF